MAYTTTNSIQALAYSTVTRRPGTRLKAYLFWGGGKERLKKLCVVGKQESLKEWTTFPLSC